MTLETFRRKENQLDKASLEVLAQAASEGDILEMVFAESIPLYLVGMHHDGFLSLEERRGNIAYIQVHSTFKENLDWFVERLAKPLKSCQKVDSIPPRQAPPPRKPDPIYFRVTAKENAPWHSNGERATAWAFGEEDEGGLAALFKEKGLM
jgi:hypothetical protein